jgi:O-antigen/teichoic acid export membrane protein
VLIVLIGNAAQFILLLLCMRVVTSYLPPEEMGHMSLILAVTAFFVLFLVNPVGMFINRRFHAWNALGSARHYFKLYALYLMILSVITAGILVVVNILGNFGFEFNTTWLLVLVCGSLFFNTINQTVIPTLNLLEFRGWFFILTLATIGLGLISAYLLVLTFSPAAEYWLMGLLIGQSILAVVGTVILFAKLNSAAVTQRLTKSHLRVLISFAWPVSIAVGFNWLQMQGYRFLAVDYLGLAELGFFIVGYGICAALVGGFEVVMTTYLQPRFYKLASSSNATTQALAWSTYAEALLPSLLLVAFMLIALAPELTRFMVGPAYQSSSQFVIWGVLAEVTRVVAGVYGMSAHAKMKTRLLILPNFLGAFICTLLILILAPKLGAHGVGLARTLAGIGLVLAMHRLIITALSMQFPYKPLLKAAAMGVLLWLMALAGRWAMDDAASLTSAGFLIVVVGLFFLSMFYLLMFSFLQKNNIDGI